MATRREFIRSFEAVDELGNEQTLHLYMRKVDVANAVPGPLEADGTTEIETEDGRAVSNESKGVYIVLVTGENLTSDDPGAP